MTDETNPAKAMEEREATSEGRAETGPLTGIKGAATGLQPGGTKPGGGSAAGTDTGTGGIGTGDGTNGAGTANGNTAAPPNR